MNEKIKNWYLKKYSSDEMGFDINTNVTFNDVIDALTKQRDVYGVIGADDSIIRERVFEKLAELLDCDYNVIYNKWLT